MNVLDDNTFHAATPAATTTRHHFVTAAQQWALLTRVPEFNKPRPSVAGAADRDDDSEERLSVLVADQVINSSADRPDGDEEAQEHSDVSAALYQSQLRVIAEQDD